MTHINNRDDIEIWKTYEKIYTELRYKDFNLLPAVVSCFLGQFALPGKQGKSDSIRIILDKAQITVSILHCFVILSMCTFLIRYSLLYSKLFSSFELKSR